MQSELKTRSELKNETFDRLEHLIITMPNRIALRLGALMVTMTVLLMAIGPCYIRWALSIIYAG